MRFLLSGVFIALIVSLLSLAQPTAGGKAKNPETAKVSGKRLYDEHCAFCHGSDAKGGGPYAASLKVWPPDLTTLTRKNNGTFPELHVSEVIDGEFDKPAHGSREMPIWGPIFRAMAHGKNDSAQVRIKALVRYIESVQEK
jgi:mono/diheme cytochrome c family protein